MASSCLHPPPDANALPQHEPVVPQAVPDLDQVEYDFVEEPSRDFFCPVTLELLINPHQTLCCGNHLLQEAASRLQRDGKPCPMCKQPQVSTIPDKFYKRRVNEIRVRCPHKKSGCEWVGGVNEVKQHSDSCPKRPWHCQYCEFESIYEVGVNKHLPVCIKYPVVCPNSCEVGSVPRCDLEAHLMVCSLQPVTCEYAEVCCDVKVPRRDLGRHMEEGQQQHLLSATLLNLRLTRENTEEKNRLFRTIEEKDETIANLQKQLKQVQEVAQQNTKAKDEEAKHNLVEKEVEHKKELAVWDQLVREKDEVITGLRKPLKQALDGLTRENKGLLQVIAEKDNRNKDIQTQLRKKDEAIKVKDKEIASKDQDLLEKNQQLREKDKDINRHLRMIEEKSAEHKRELEQKDETIADLQKQLKQVQDGLEAKVTDLQRQVVKYGENTEEHLKQQDKHVECVSLRFRHLQGFSVYDFTLTKFKVYQTANNSGSWHSEPFHSHPGGYKFKLNVCTNGYDDDCGVYMTVWFKLLEGDHDDELDWPVSTTAHVQLLNQLGDHSHHEKTSTDSWRKVDRNYHGGSIGKFFKLTELGLNAKKNIHYLKNDCLYFKVYMKAETKC